MNYILIDNFNGTINIICKDDDSGEPLVFESLTDAQKQLSEQCQNGIIVPLDTPLYTEEQVLDILVCWEQTLNPETFETSRDLDTVDFLDAARSKASELNILTEFEIAAKKAGQDEFNG